MNFQSPYLARLQDLKIWQGSYDSLLQNKSKESSRPSEYETIEGLSVLDSSNDTDKRYDDTDWDKKAISPTKTFAQLLEEKLAEDKPITAQSKPKKPYLKKGAGLLRYKLGPKVIAAKSTQNGILRPTGKRSSSPRHNKSVKVTVDANTEPELCMIPLKMPDLNVKSKATWSKITNNVETNDGFKRIPKNVSPNTNSPEKRKNFIGKINELAFKHFHDNKNYESQNGFRSEPINVNKENESLANTESENTMDRDLKIFESLEERVEHPSFSSTNSSIVRMLISTPRKVKNAFKTVPIREEMQPDNHLLNPSLANKIEEVNKKTDVLHEFLNNLRKIADNNQTKKWHFEPTAMVDEKSGTSTNTSYSETTTNTDTRSQSPSSFYTDFENTLGGNNSNNNCHRTDAAVNTSVIVATNNTSTKELDAKCLNCEELRERLDKIQSEIPDIQKEKAKICDFAKELESKRDQLSMEIQRLQKKYDEDVSDLRDEIAVEKRKFAKEKAIFDMYMKESNKMPSKKERDEIMILKKELTDTKELLKLKEAKNGATQARLRNQIKLLEKEKSELKGQVESLQKENSKLIAAQKVRRPSEVKMLHEINRNLTKLANKQVTKSDTSNEMKKDDDRCERRLSNDDLYQKDKDTSPKQRKKSFNAKRRSSIEIPNDNSGNVTTFANLSIEKEYENVFGNSPKSEMQQTTSLNESKKGKTETIFPDGSKQIKYSNGNSKTISPNGQMIVVQYYNGDIKETNLVENNIKYYYAENNTWQTQFKDGSELLEYSNGQKEKKFKDGRKEVTCPDGTRFIRFVDGTEEVHYPDGSIMVKNENGDKVLLLPNGQKEIHSKDHKRREYPDGTVKILYPDGTQETRYSSGRVRIKDANGVLILDSES